jgi:hypothetical protein
MELNTGRDKYWIWLTIPIAVLLAIAAGGGIFFEGLYRDNAYFASQAVGQDFVSLAVVLPILIVTAVLAWRGSTAARLIWSGGLVYLVYTYVVACFADKFNAFFLVYVALLGCSLYALIGSAASADMAGIRARFGARTPVKVVSVYLGILAVLFYALRLREIVPALAAGEIPQSILDNGTPTNPIHVLDMAWILPAFLIAAVSLWRKKDLGYMLAGALLSYGVLLMSAILSIAIFMSREGQPVTMPQVVIFVVLLAVSLGMLSVHLQGLKAPGRLKENNL